MIGSGSDRAGTVDSCPSLQTFAEDVNGNAGECAFSMPPSRGLPTVAHASLVSVSEMEAAATYNESYCLGVPTSPHLLMRATRLEDRPRSLVGHPEDAAVPEEALQLAARVLHPDYLQPLECRRSYRLDVRRSCSAETE